MDPTITVRDRRRGNGTTAYCVRIRTRTTETTRTFTTRRARDTFMKRARHLGIDEALRVLALCPEPVEPTLGEWADHCYRERDLTEGTARNYRAYRVELGKLAHYPITTISRDDVTRWTQALTRSGNSPKTVANKHGWLASIFADAVTAGHVTINPAEGTRLPKKHRREMLCLTPAQVGQLADMITPHYRSLVLFLATTGLRFGEATALAPEDVDGDTIRVVKAWRRSRSGGWEVGPPKTRRSVRSVALTPQVADLLNQGRGRAFIFETPSGRPVRHATFTERHWTPTLALLRGEPLPAGSRADAVLRAREPASPAWSVKPRIHDLRHTAASWWLAAGTDIHVVRDQLGHESITTTLDTYGHLLPGARDEARARMAAFTAGLGL